MIVSNRRYMFGIGQVGVVQVDGFRCGVCTAPEGLFKGYSVIFYAFDGEWAARQNQRVVAKAMMHSSMSSKQRSEFHGALLAHLDTLGIKGTGLADAIDEVFAAAKGRNHIVDSVNFAHLSVANEDSDVTSAGSLTLEAAEASEREVARDADRLMAIVSGIAARVGKAPVGYNDRGEVFVHPDLTWEPQRPGNEELMEMLLGGLRANVSPNDSSETHASISFSVGPYRLDAPVGDLTGLVEFSTAEYAIIGRLFKGEKSYNAPPVQFLGRRWQLRIQTVNGQICKIAPHAELASR
jgi:hypothetical protein